MRCIALALIAASLALPAHAKGPVASAPPDTFAIVHLKPKALSGTTWFRRLTDETFVGQTLDGARLALGERLGGDVVADVHGVTAYISGSLYLPRFAVHVDGVVPVAGVRAALQGEGWTPARVEGLPALRSPSGAYLAHVTPTRVVIGPTEHFAWMHAGRGVAPALNPLLEQAVRGELGWIVAYPPTPLTVWEAPVVAVGGLWGTLGHVDDALVFDGEIGLRDAADARDARSALAAEQVLAALDPRAVQAGLSPAWRAPVLSARGRTLGVWIEAGAHDLDQLVYGLMAMPAPEPDIDKVWRPPPPGLQLDWVRIPRGHVTFRRKCSATGDPPPLEGEPVRAFDLSRHEVTVAQYRLCVEAKRCPEPRRDRARGCNWGVPGRDAHPMNCVTTPEALDFAEWAGARLPDESEWAHAARGGPKATRYPWGDAPVGCDRATLKIKGKRGCGRGHTVPVCSRPKGNTPHGVCDLAGNVAEIVLSFALEEAFRVEGPDRVAPDGSKAPPLGEPPPIRVRGGRWDADWKDANVFDRPVVKFRGWSPGVGFRVVRWTPPP